MSDSDGVDKALHIMRDTRFATVTVVDDHDRLVSRPMTVQEVTDEGEAWFFIDRTSDHAHQVGNHSQVNVAFSDGSSWVSVSGTATVVVDRARTEELWDAAVEAWFPGGKDDDAVALLRVRPDTAEYWATAGRVATALAFVKAKVTGNPPDGDSGVVQMP